MDVAISTLRAELAGWVERARSGEDVVVTDRGTPVARLVAVDSAPLLERLADRGLLGKPEVPTRPVARAVRRVSATGPVADLVGEQRG